MPYNNLVITTRGTFRLWDTNFMYSIDLHRTDRDIVEALLTKAQITDLFGEFGYDTVLTDEQMQTLRDDPLFYQEV